MNKTLIKTLVLTVTIMSSSVFAQSGSMSGMNMDHSMSGMNMGDMDMSKMGDMSAASLVKLSGKAFDRAFLSMMIPHHQSAVDMAKAVLPLTKDGKVKTWATDIVKSQQAEINTMTGLLKPLGGVDSKMAAMMDSMKSMGSMIKTAKNPDMAFVQGMLPHHSSAIDMAKIALERSNDPKVLQLAQDIVLAQAREMYEFRTWLLKQ